MTLYPDILVLSRAHDRRGQMMFYDRFCQDVYRSAFALLGQTGEAEEVMQEVLLKALERISEADPDEQLMRRRLRRMAVNASIDLLRKRKDSSFFLDEAIADMSEEDAEEMQLLEIRVSMLKQAVDRLPSGYRTIVNLRLVEEMGFDEIAGVLCISSSTARSQFTRAKQKLIQWLKK